MKSFKFTVSFDGLLQVVDATAPSLAQAIRSIKAGYPGVATIVETH